MSVTHITLFMAGKVVRESLIPQWWFLSAKDLHFECSLGVKVQMTFLWNDFARVRKMIALLLGSYWFSHQQVRNMGVLFAFPFILPVQPMVKPCPLFPRNVPAKLSPFLIHCPHQDACHITLGFLQLLANWSFCFFSFPLLEHLIACLQMNSSEHSSHHIVSHCSRIFCGSHLPAAGFHHSLGQAPLDHTCSPVPLTPFLVAFTHHSVFHWLLPVLSLVSIETEFHS